MTSPKRPAAVVDRLVDHIFDGATGDALADEMRGWLAGSPRYRSFADAHRDKIRKKVRGTADPESRLDLRAELRVAHLLLANRRIALAFEAYGAQKGGPDFTVTFGGERPFNLEVKRIRRAPPLGGDEWPALTKLRQLPSGVPNAVLLAVDAASAEGLDTDAGARGLRSRADAKDEAFFVSRGFRGTRDFYDRYLRLGAVLVWSERAAADSRAALWINRSARISVPARAARACLAALAGA